MNRKISLDLAQHHYYLQIPSAQQQPLFHCVFAYDALLKSLEQHSDIELYGYCLFPNSLHLLVLSHKPPSHWLEAWLMNYNQWHQDATRDTGYLFDDDNIHQVLIQPKHLCKTLRHIHYLPVQNKICSSPEQFLYTSYHDYINHQQTGVNTTPVLATLSPHYGQRLRRFQDYMAIPNQENKSLFQTGNHDYYLAYADAYFIMQARASYQNTHNVIPESELLLLWQNCVKCLVEHSTLESAFWLGQQRHHSLPDAHYVLSWLFTKIANGPLYIAAKQLGIDEATLKLKINSIHLHHPAKYLRYIERSWKTATV